MPLNLSTGEILVLLLVAILVFGGNLPDVARRVGKAIHEFKGGMRDEMRKLDRAVDPGPPPGWTPPPDGDECCGLGGAKTPDDEVSRPGS